MTTMKPLKLITELYEDVTSLFEEVDGKKQLFIEGTFAQAEKKNRNGRIYPSSILEREVNKFINEWVNTKRALGELNHPASPTVDPKNASHRIVEMRKEGNDFYGKALILNTPMGNIVRGLMEGGTNIGVSTRGLGTVKTSGGAMVVQEDFKLATIDIVSNPSGIDCWVNGLMEGVEWIFEEGILKQVTEQKIEEIKKELDKPKLSEADMLKAFNKFLNALNNK
jgi:hypothetical protein